MIEIRWHGRGGQGVKTAALLLADCVISAGKFATAFPEYGPERMGAPVCAFNRIDTKHINLHCGISSPDVVVVLDETLINALNVVDGLSEDGMILVNTKSYVKERLKVKNRVYTIDASGISRFYLGRDLPNTPMLGALVRVLDLVSLDELLQDTQRKLSVKFVHKPQLIEANLAAIKQGYETVKEEV